VTIPSSVGRYRVTGEVGRGAMGVVYRGTDPALDRTVAIKVIRVGVADSSVPPEELEARFLREAKVAARISHPNVVTVFDAGREGHGQPEGEGLRVREGERLGHELAEDDGEQRQQDGDHRRA